MLIAHFPFFFLLALILVSPLSAQTPAIPDPVKAGQELAKRLREAGPAKSAKFSGSMMVTRPDRTNTFPITSAITVTETNWQISYGAEVNGARESFAIVHTAKAPNEYFIGNAGSTNANTGPGRALQPGELYQPFAGSHFWRVDLGLDFFWWPQQRQIKSQMRRGRSCRVLESRNPKPAPGAYGHVVSWIDVETDGILRAEAYDAQNRLVKEFLVGSFRKVDGQYQLEDISIRLPESREETRIKFDLDRTP